MFFASLGVLCAQESGDRSQAVSETVAIQASAPSDDTRANPFAGMAPLEMRYRSLAEIRDLLSGWAQLGGDYVRPLALPGDIPAIEFGSGDLTGLPLETRRTVLLVGGMDGQSVAGGEAVLQACSTLLTHFDSLRPDLCIVAIPWAAPEMLAQVDRGQVLMGRDLDGDGLVLEMLVERADGPLAFSEDRRFLVPAREGDAPRYRKMVEGSEGLAQAAVRPDGAFAVGHGEGAGQSLGADTLPGFLTKFVLTRSVACAIVFQGNHGGIRTPRPLREGGLEQQAIFDRLARVLAFTGGRSNAKASPREGPIHGLGSAQDWSFAEWCYAVPGVMSFEVAPWGPVAPGVEGLDRSQGNTNLPELWSGRPPLVGDALLWARWLDDVQGGLGFVEWRPVERDGEALCLVGGWKPKTFHNPPEGALGQALAGVGPFVQQVIAQQPSLELCDVAVQREGDLCTLRARLRLTGAMPLWSEYHGLWAGAQGQAAPWLALDLPAAVQRLAGPGRIDFPGLVPGGKSQAVEWLLFAPSGLRVDLGFGIGGAWVQSREVGL